MMQALSRSMFDGPPGYPYWGLTFTAEQANSTVAMDAQANAPAVSLEFSVDGGYSWRDFLRGVDGGATGDVITLQSVGDSVCFRAGPDGTGGDGINYRMAGGNSAGYANVFKLSGKVAASGDISSIIDRHGPVLTYDNTRRFAFLSLFENCSALTSAPDLPATTLANSCYRAMFRGCTGLVDAPALPAAVLNTYCYYLMFSGCANLENAPALPADTLFYRCYSYMFQSCRKLTELRVAFTEWAVDGEAATAQWASGITGSGTFYCPRALGVQDPDDPVYPQIERGVGRCPTNWSVVNTD